MLYTCRQHHRAVSCCTAETAECISCSYGQTVAEFCSEHPETAGCPRGSKCYPPASENFNLPHKGCPADGDSSSCVANDEHFQTLVEAWEACGRITECGIIMKYTDGYYYLRRRSDPDMDIAGSHSMLYNCKRHHWLEGCCTEETAECISCSSGKTISELCAELPYTAGCPQAAPVHEVCSPPTSGFDLPHKGCPVENDRSSCVANNAHFHTLGDAWDACSRTAECGVIMKFTDGYYYMRRRSDPDREFAGSHSLLYTCVHPEPQKTVYVAHDVCDPPEYGFDLPNKGCAVHLDESSCIDGNAHYSTLLEAWHACGQNPECGVVTKWTDGMFYLRRHSDPDQPVAGARSILYTCATTSNRPVYVRESTTHEAQRVYEDCDDKVVRCSHTGPTD